MSPLTERTRSPEAATLGCHVCDGGQVQFIGDVVADAGQGAEVDFLEAEVRDRAERRGQVLVPEADGRAAESGVEHRR